MTDKRTQRKMVLQQLSELEHTLHAERSLKLVGKLFARQEWQQANVIATTLSRHPEIATETIILKALQEGKKVVLPRTYIETKEMVFKNYRPGDNLEKKKMDLAEPLETAETVNKNAIDLVLVPGVVFNQENYRIGFGAGFYDRFLSDYLGTSISLCLNEQFQPFQPEVHDIPVDILIRENQ